MNIEAIIRAINVNGSQGPQDLRAQREYGWVRQDIDIDYETYIRTLEAHCIDCSERHQKRNAYIVRKKDGKLQRFKTSEAELRGFVCYVIAKQNDLTSDIIKNRVKLLFTGMTPVDIMLQGNLDSPQEIIDQTIRNILVSNRTKSRNNALLRRSNKAPYTYTLTAEGYQLAQEVEHEMVLSAHGIQNTNDITNSGSTPYNLYDIEHYSRNNEGFVATPLQSAPGLFYPVNARLKMLCKARSRYRCEFDYQHETFLSRDGIAFVEGHHLVPMSVQKNFKYINLDCLENLISLCPNCHRAIHLGDDIVRSRIAKKLFIQRLQNLQSIGLDMQSIIEIAWLFYACKI